MLFSSIAIKTSIPATAPAATSGALSVSSIDAENWLQITGEASAGAGSLYLLRWNATLEEWRIYMEDAVDSSALGGLFSAAYPCWRSRSRDESDPAARHLGSTSRARRRSRRGTPDRYFDRYR